MRTGLVIFARMSSSRLPGKTLMDIGGRSLLGLVVDRARRVPDGEVIVATSTDASDDPLLDFARQEDVPIFRGTLDDVAQRALDCADRFQLDRFARICGDRPFFPPEIVDQLLRLQADQDLDLATNALEKTFPAGATTEIVRTEALRAALGRTDDPADREHVTRYFYRHPDQFRIGNLRAQQSADAVVALTVDTTADLERARYIAAHLSAPLSAAPLAETVQLARAWHQLKGAPLPGSMGPSS